MNEKFKNFINNAKNVILVLLSCFIGFLLLENNKLENEAQSNYVLLTDSLSDYKNKVGELYKEKESYLIDNENLKALNKDLYNEIKHLKDNPIVVTKTEVKYEIKEVFIKNDSVNIDNDNNIITNFYNYKDDYLSANISHSLNLFNNSGNLTLNNISTSTNLYLDIVEKDKKPYLIGRTDNPYLTINNMDGGFVNLDKSKLLDKYYRRKNRWNLSFNLGFFAIYNINTNRFEAGPGGGISLGYSIVQF